MLEEFRTDIWWRCVISCILQLL